MKTKQKRETNTWGTPFIMVLQLENLLNEVDFK
jgi:hypothetical protein